MKRNKSIIFITILLFMFFIISISVLPINVKGVDYDYDFSFSNDTFYSESNIDSIYFNDSFNMRNQSYLDGHYNATYSFENDINNQPPISWTTIGNGGTIKVISNLGSHNKVVELDDTNNTDYIQFANIFDKVQSFGTVEFWIEGNDVSDFIELTFRTGGIRYLTLGIDSDKVQYFYTGSWHDATNGVVLNDIWYHFKIDFSCSTDTFDFYLNNILLDDNIPFRNVATNITYMYFRTSDTDSNYKYYIDAVGYSWDVDYLTNYTYTFNELTPDTEFSDTGIYTNWSYSKDTDTNITVRDYTPIDSEFLRFYDDNNNGYPRLRIPFTDSITNIFSFYMRFSDVNEVIYIYLQDGSSDKISIYTHTGNLRIYDGGTPTIIMSISNDVWYNITISFDCISDTNDVYVDSILKGTYDFESVATSLNYLEFRTDLSDTGYYMDLDSLYNFISVDFLYSIGLNLFSGVYTDNSIKEVDKFEFAIKSANNLYPIGFDNPSTWSDIENGYDNTNIAIDTTNPINNRVVQIVGNGTTYETTGIEKNFNQVDGIFNITLEINMTKWDNSNGSFNYSIYSYDNTEIVKLGLHMHSILGGSLYRYDGTDWIELIPNTDPPVITPNKLWFIDIYIKSWIILNFYQVSPAIDRVFNFSKIDTSKKGLGKIKLTSEIVSDPTNDNIINIHNIGVYNNNTSLSTDFGYLEKDLFDTDIWWIFAGFSQYYTTAIGSFTTLVASYDYTLGSNTESIKIHNNYTGFDYTNLLPYDFVHFPSYGIQKPKILYFCNSELYITSLLIEGMRFKYQNTTFDYNFEYNGIDYNESYFYIQSDKLYFTYYADDTNVEYIQAIFSGLITLDMNTTDSGLEFNSYKSGLQAYGYFGVEYISTENVIPINTYFDFSRTILKPNEKIHHFNILITDNNDDTVLGLTTGYIHNIAIIKITDLSISVITLSLIGMMIPLIILLVPSIAISNAIRKSLLIPFFLIMTIICVATGLIPIWIGFIIFISNSVFLLKNEIVD